MSKKYLTEYPLLMAEWDYEKNFGLSPEQLTHGSGLSVFWKCKTCGHSWQAKINNRTHGRNCPVCSNRVIIPGINDLATTHPNIAKEWDYIKNRDLTPNMVSHGCG
jgi:DNA-directed RNA polymerase subunit RPC12/RpoP